jgi:hypothetical protein
VSPRFATEPRVSYRTLEGETESAPLADIDLFVKRRPSGAPGGLLRLRSGRNVLVQDPAGVVAQLVAHKAQHLVR